MAVLAFDRRLLPQYRPVRLLPVCFDPASRLVPTSMGNITGSPKPSILSKRNTHGKVGTLCTKMTWY